MDEAWRLPTSAIRRLRWPLTRLTAALSVAVHLCDMYNALSLKAFPAAAAEEACSRTGEPATTMPTKHRERARSKGEPEAQGARSSGGSKPQHLEPKATKRDLAWTDKRTGVRTYQHTYVRGPSWYERAILNYGKKTNRGEPRLGL